MSPLPTLTPDCLFRLQPSCVPNMFFHTPNLEKKIIALLLFLSIPGPDAKKLLIILLLLKLIYLFSSIEGLRIVECLFTIQLIEYIACTGANLHTPQQLQCLFSFFFQANFIDKCSTFGLKDSLVTYVIEA